MSNPPRPPSLLSSFLSATGMTAPYTQTDDDVVEDNKHETTLPPVPSFLLASTLPPALLSDPFSSQFSLDGTVASSAAGTSGSIPPRPRRLWQLQDKLRPIPPYYPPLDPNCTCLVTDVSASLVAVRITECLRKRSIAAEYDEESATAQCMTVDRAHFTIHLYRGSKSSAMENEDAILAAPVPPPIIVECQRQSGNVASFHTACSAVLHAAKGNDTGSDRRKPQFTNGMEFRSLSPALKRCKLVHNSSSRPRPIHQRSSNRSMMSTLSTPSMAAEAAFEGARELLQKDRLECQVLGMERLVNLTNLEISGEDVSRYVSQRLLQDDWLLDSFLMHPEAEQAMATLKTTSKSNKSKWDRSNQEFENTALLRSFLESSAAVTSSSRFVSLETEDRNPTISPSGSQSEDLSLEECTHEAKLRSLALRVLCNSLYSLKQSGDLQGILLPHKSDEEQTSKRKCGIANTSINLGDEVKASRLIQPPFLMSLVQDMQGASRPPSVSEIGFQMASVHESALAIRCLRLLAGGSSSTSTDNNSDDDDDIASSSALTRVQDFLRNEVVLESLELARSCGRATHTVLQKEAERTYTQLTEDVRSC